jgi:CcmD family protein
MNAIKFLFAAYIATWVIHGIYLGSLVRRFSRLRKQLKEVKASSFRRSAPGFHPQG